ncbi:Uncharacterized protein EJ110_NYTH46180 [Nymphaea thermarum]|nr:Uncharacterized protein EJ110_NYTH46180 [Nymphaea thermarum]
MDSFIDHEVAASVVKKRRHYTSKQTILLVGEGDFSFSLSLASAFGSATGMVATSLDSKDWLAYKYCSATSNVERLRQLGCRVLHGIDATTMSKNRSLRTNKCDRIVYNFPHAGFICPETSAFQIELHKHLLMGFFENARELLSHGHGEVHVTHKQGYPYSKWELEKIAEKNGFVLVQASRFRLSHYPGYVNKRGAGSHPDRTFFVGRASTFRFKIDAGLRDWPDLRSLQMVYEFFAETGNNTSAIKVAEGTKATGPAITTAIMATNDSDEKICLTVETARPALESMIHRPVHTTSFPAINTPDKKCKLPADDKSTAILKLLIKTVKFLVRVFSALFIGGETPSE